MSDRSHHLFHHLAGFLVLVMMVLVSLLAKAAEPDIFTRAMDARSQGKVDEAYQLLEEAVNQGIRAHDAYYIICRKSWLCRRGGIGRLPGCTG
ncbi:MAG: hypothetical protein NTX88_12225 [Candidatus Atribacteria bacterium]|nr:hypothetical protein [Candidatus Atribacteria bacterium]